MLYQLINETLVRQFPNYIDVDGVVYTNEAAREKARESGEWFELVTEDRPQYNEETQILIRNYYQDGDKIHCGWIIQNLDNSEVNYEN